MTAHAHERTDPPYQPENMPAVDEVLRQAWEAMELPEGCRAEIIEGAIELSSAGRFSHGQIVNRLRDDLVLFLKDGDFAARSGLNVIHKGSAWVPDLFIVPRDAERYVTADGTGITAAAVRLVVGVVSPDRRGRHRDRTEERKRREYARAAIPVYVVIDDYDGQGTVTVLTEPRPDQADWVGVHRVSYGTEVTVPEGPAKGFAVTEAITGPARTRK
ncbi:Uma2 family endonuclease [Streptomyces apricus]|uniref:Uma2 family endonuclease n=1 Tax=Streptomyces apricus TaxID=1828112 RepID=A0A5B0AM88_9ACTN|nr:Uma2 family endonuclease [Streptomyces apricus]KAA0929725.1 Uma2 family endonuclease [Streptomyces apricus]